MFGAYTFGSVDNPRTHLQAFYHLTFMEIFTESIWVEVQTHELLSESLRRKSEG